MDNINKYNDNNVKIILCGTKNDIKQNREIDYEECVNKAKELKPDLIHKSNLS